MTGETWNKRLQTCPIGDYRYRMFNGRTGAGQANELPCLMVPRLTHPVYIIEMNGDSYRLKGSRQNAVSSPPEEPTDV